MSSNDSTKDTHQTVSITSLPRIELHGIPSTTTMIVAIVVAAAGIVGSILGVGNLVLDRSLQSMEKSLQATEERLKSHHTETLHAVSDPMQLQIAASKSVLSLLIAKNGRFSKGDKEAFGKVLGIVRPDEIQELANRSLEQIEKVSYAGLERNKQIEIHPPLPGLVWNGDGKVVLKYLDVKDPNLDLSKADFYGEGANPCRTKNLDLPGQPVGTVKLCYTHLSKNRLELIVVRPSSQDSGH